MARIGSQHIRFPSDMKGFFKHAKQSIQTGTLFAVHHASRPGTAP
jgi:hypothetical protein